MVINRLFDIPYFQLKNYKQSDALAEKINGEWKLHSTENLIASFNKVSTAFLEMGVQPNDKIAIIANNRPQWNFIDFGLLQIGAINVPLYPNISEQEYEFIFNDADVKYVFVSTKEIADKVANIKNKTKSLIDIYSFDKIEGVKYWEEIFDYIKKDRSDDIKKIADNIKPNDLATIIYTSGTTGTPKGVMLSHNNIASNVKACLPLLPVGENDKAFSFLPMNHVFERMLVYLYMSAGLSVYYAESIDAISDNLKEVKPHIFGTVPRLLEKVYDKIYAKGLELNGIKKALFFWALNLGLKYEYNGENGWWYETQLKLANKLIFNKWREALGGNIRTIVTGGAALQDRLAKVFTAGGIPIQQGYGLTETSPVIAVNRCLDTKKRYFGTVGPLIDGVEVQIAEDGEILCKGPNIMLGYYKRQDLTKEAVIDGWFHTGDIGEFIEKNGNQFLKITDRKKEMFKTSGGKYCAPQPIENKLKEDTLIEEIMVVGEGEKFVAALIVPAMDNLKEWCAHKKLDCNDNESICQNADVIAKYRKIIDKYNPQFSHVEQIKKFKLIPQSWTVETGELTPTMKLKRKVIKEKFKEQLEKLYRG